MMFGYATNETENYMPLPIYLAHELMKELAALRRENNEIKYLRPDAKSQVTIEYSNDHKPVKIDTIVISTQHDEFDTDEEMLKKIRKDIVQILIPRVIAKLKPEIQKLFTSDIKYQINPTGKFVIGGPHGDTGLTGRKIIVDTYGGKGAHGGGAFSGKDPSKVDRSAAYAARHVAKNIVAAKLAEEVEVQVAYAIGLSHPVSIDIQTFGTGVLPDTILTRIVEEIVDLRPAAIVERLNLLRPQYRPTAAYGHFGRGEFAWEQLDYIDALAEAARSHA